MASPNFSPAQVLSAGRRAEADGQHDHAQQFFRHIIQHYPSSTEADDALDGLRRVERERRQLAGKPIAHEPAAHIGQTLARHSAPELAARLAPRGLAEGAVSTSEGAPEPAPGKAPYRAARWLIRLFALLGTGLVGAGIGLAAFVLHPVAGLTLPEPLASAPVPLALADALGLGLSGTATLLGCALASAVFDAAGALRALAARMEP